jgi:LacI family transcriptional regulator
VAGEQDGMATIKDVAAKAGVSVATVSHVMNESRFVSQETRQRVVEAITELGYRRDGIARSLRRSRTGTIGAVVSDITNPFFSDLVKGIENTIHGFPDRLNVILCNSEEDEALERELLDILMEKRVDGLIIAPAGGNVAYLETLGLHGPPIVFVDRALPAVAADAVTVDNVSASRDAVEHLIARGHRRIAVLRATLQASSIEDRVEGYRRTMAAAGLRVDPDWIVESSSNIDAAHAAGRQLLALAPRPDAVFTTNNFMTLGLLRALNEAGLSSPEDIAIAGFDDFHWAEAFRPRITAVAQSGYEQGAEAARLLAARIAKTEQGPPISRVIPTRLIIRESSG